MAAYQKWMDAKQRGLAVADRPYEVDGIQFMDSSIIVDQYLPNMPTAMFVLGRAQAVPTLTLVTPAGTEITPDSLPANVNYQEDITYTRDLSFTLTPAIVANSYACTAPAQPPAGTTCLHFTNARPDLGAVDVLLDGAPVLTNVAFGSEPIGQAVPSGVHNLTLIPAGGGSTLYSGPVILTDGAVQRLIAAGDMINTLILNVSHSDPIPTDNQAAVHFVNTALDAPNLDIIMADKG